MCSIYFQIGDIDLYIYLRFYWNAHHFVSSLMHSIVQLYNFTNLMRVKFYIIVVWISISHITNEIECLFKWLWTICVSAPERCPLMYCASFFYCVISFRGWRISLYVLNTNYCWFICCTYRLPFCGLSFDINISFCSSHVYRLASGISI